MRLIDADALIAEYDRVHIGAPGSARKLMQNAPTVDAVEVVRCKDGEYYEGDECVNPYVFMSDGAHLYTDPSDFCSYGERREEK